MIKDGPAQLWIVRHGQSAGNVARDLAEASGAAMIDIAFRDVDTPLSALGEEQSVALGGWFAALPPSQRPDAILCSPYVRARETARLLLAQMPGGAGLRVRVDERLREKEFGILDRLTVHGIRQKYPELSEQRGHVGKFYFRPPGGESWCDVILRLRSLLEMVAREYAGQRLLLVAHQVTVTCVRYLLEELDEAQVLAIDRQGDVPNCSVTSYRRDAAGTLARDLVYFVAPLREAGAPITTEPDAPLAAKP
ncbi:histidine phosphatase family protein [Ramlibacter tataouinensis]|uniref:Phosphoglycerate mutase-like protein n=1 Tax=Ramlibacter tataouinensis (strain ATCC BAA-407 / DSM 14655 / LMG 21543 / TTB310) TaxID=365046 RepID=F5XXQ5_RAMTT|nr:histidine phosphatase family protein [Ramlibacter tataouinensis]AEG91858.1 Phosphoglycerate mutase-like protein [Ramlibacter tataouinensis TTB310]